MIEDDKRLFEKNSDFTDKFIKLSRDVHFLNDDRARIKLEINNHTGSTIKEINTKLWFIEDEKRKCEKNSDFNENFIKLSRDVHFLNDNRANIKLEINNLTGSKIKEIKEYTKY